MQTQLPLELRNEAQMGSHGLLGLLVQTNSFGEKRPEGGGGRRCTWSILWNQTAVLGPNLAPPARGSKHPRVLQNPETGLELPAATQVP